MTDKSSQGADPTRSWQRNYYAVWPSLLLVSMGLMSILPSLPLYIEERFGIVDPDRLRIWTGAIWAGAPLAAACIGPFWGALGDRIGRKPMVLRALLGIALSTGLMPLAGSPGALLGFRILQGLLAGYVAPSMALVTANAPPTRQGRSIGSLQVALAAGLLLGPWVGAELMRITGHRENAFYLTSALALLASLPVMLFAREDRQGLREHRRQAASISTEIGRILSARLLWILFLCILLMRLGQAMVEAYIALWVRELGPWMVLAETTGDVVTALERSIALPFTVLAIAQILLTTSWGRLADRHGPLRCLAILALGLGTVQALIGSLQDIEAYLLLRCLAALFMAGSMALAYSAIAKRVHSDQRSLAYACAQSCIQFGLALGPLLGGFASHWTGISGLYFISAFVLLSIGLVMLALRRRTMLLAADLG